jgi:bacillithiol biosynthesis cysteine-adding enzyme BshC
MTAADKIAYRRIPGHSPLFLQYVDREPAVLKFYQGPPSLEALHQKAHAIARSERFPRQEMRSLLRHQNRAFQCGPRSLEHIDALAQPDCVAVVTGQQVGLFTGPLYTIYKALTAIRLAAELQSRNIPAIPVFWMDAEDHDLAEVTHVAALGPESTVHRMEWGSRLFGDTATRPLPVGARILPDGIRECVAEYASFWSGARHADDCRRDLGATYAAGRSLMQAFALAMAAIFREHGLVLFNPADPDVKRLAEGVFGKAVRDAGPIRAALAERNKALSLAGYHSQVGISRDATLIFLILEGERRSLTKPDDRFGLKNSGLEWDTSGLLDLNSREPECFSPNVLLRPIVQDHLLPTVAYVAGPAEIAYFAQIEALYRHFDRSMPIIWPRAGFTLLDPDAAERMRCQGVEIGDLLLGKDHVSMTMIRSSGLSGLLPPLAGLRESLAGSLEALRPGMASLDFNLGPALDLATRKILHNTDRLYRRAVRLETALSGATAREAERLLNRLYPNSVLQERVFGIHPFLAHFGPSLIGALHAAIDCHRFVHQVIRLE